MERVKTDDDFLTYAYARQKELVSYVAHVSCNVADAKTSFAGINELLTDTLNVLKIKIENAKVLQLRTGKYTPGGANTESVSGAGQAGDGDSVPF